MTYKGQLRLLTLGACTVLSTCRSKSEAERVVRASITDPDSVEFGDFYFNTKTKKGCLTVNGKNKMRGFTGDQQAFVERTDNGWIQAGILAMGPADCKEMFADRAN